MLPVVEARVVVAVPGRVGEVRVAADEPEAVDLDPGVFARRLDAPAAVKAVLEQGGRVVLRGRAVLDPGPSGGSKYKKTTIKESTQWQNPKSEMESARCNAGAYGLDLKRHAEKA